MSMTTIFNGATLVKPGAYTRTFVNLSNGAAIPQTGIIGLIGEADGGEPGADAGVVEYTIEQIREIIETYKSGQIVEGARALAHPSRDARLPNGASLIKVYKTNASTQATGDFFNLDDANTGAGDALIDVTSQNWGDDENFINFTVSEGTSVDEAATLTSGTITFPATITNADTLVLSVNGVTHTLTLTGVASGTFSRAQVITLLNGTVTNALTPAWAPANPIVASENTSSTKIDLAIDNTEATLDGFEHRHEYGILAAGASSLATTLVLLTASSINGSTLTVTAGTAGPVRGVRGTRIITEAKNDVSKTLTENDNAEMFRIYYIGAGTASVMDVLDVSGVKRLQTSCAGAAADDLDIDLTGKTVKQLVDLINTNAAYTCITTYYNSGAKFVTDIDYYSGVDIRTLPLSVLAAVKEIEAIIAAEAIFISVASVSNVYGWVKPVSTAVFLTGGSKGGSTNGTIQNGMDAFLGTRINTLVPLFSQDSSNDITDGITDGSSTYTIDAILLQADTHCRTASNTKNRSERDWFGAKKDTLASQIIASRALNSEFAGLWMQSVRVIDINGNLTVMPPHIGAALAAGMQAGSEIGEPITFKYMNVFGLEHDDFDPRTQGDTALLAGLMFAEQPDFGGFRLVLGNTTYQKDANFVYNRKSVMQAVQLYCYQLRQNLEALFVGTARQRKQATSEAVKNAIIAFNSQKLIEGVLVGDDANNGLGYLFDTLIVSVDGNIIRYNETITPVQGVDFVLGDIEIDTIRDVA